MSKIKVPHIAYIGPKEFEIQYGSRVVEEGVEVSGSAHGPNQKICISLTQAKDKKQLFEAILHETLHAILYVTGHKELIGNEKKEEALVVLFEVFLGDSIDYTNSPLWGEWKSVRFK